jgi:two-component system, OmpR family, sensor histidine kinase ArlS
MTLKRRFAIYVSAAFFIMFGIGTLVVYLSFSSFRRVEFSDRLEEKALTTVELLLNVQVIDKQLLRVIDQNSINKLYNEKTLVFDENYNLIYSSIDEASIPWNRQDVVSLKKRKRFFKTDQEREILGIYYAYKGKDYYILVAAVDKYGKSKLRYLSYTLMVTFLVGTLVVWLSTNFIIRYLTKPLDEFQRQIIQISGHELNTQIPIQDSRNDEITLLTRAFNQMLGRIEKAFAAQREFTSNASHELRTPISRITLQLDNLLKSDELSASTRSYLKSISNNVSQLTELINSLLLLAKNSETRTNFKTERIDEIIFSAYDQARKLYPDFKLNFEIEESETFADNLEIRAARPILEIAFLNLLKNAYQYSPNQTASVRLTDFSSDQLLVIVSNEGVPLLHEEIQRLFQPFTRGTNARQTSGSGLGLSIVKRILDYHGATIAYSWQAPDTHQFSMLFRSDAPQGT